MRRLVSFGIIMRCGATAVDADTFSGRRRSCLGVVAVEHDVTVEAAGRPIRCRRLLMLMHHGQRMAQQTSPPSNLAIHRQWLLCHRHTSVTIVHTMSLSSAKGTPPVLLSRLMNGDVDSGGVGGWRYWQRHHRWVGANDGTS